MVPPAELVLARATVDGINIGNKVNTTTPHHHHQHPKKWEFGILDSGTKVEMRGNNFENRFKQ